MFTVESTYVDGLGTDRCSFCKVNSVKVRFEDLKLTQCHMHRSINFRCNIAKFGVAACDLKLWVTCSTYNVQVIILIVSYFLCNGVHALP